MGEKTKKITFGYVMSWVFGIIFIISGLAVITYSVFSGILIVLLSVMIVPYFNKVSSEKWNFEISAGVKFLLVLVILILFFVSVPTGSTDTTNKGPGPNSSDSTNSDLEESSGDTRGYEFGEVFELGSFLYKFKDHRTTDSFEEGYRIGEVEASGEFFVVNLSVRNIGTDSSWFRPEKYIAYKGVNGKTYAFNDSMELTFKADTLPTMPLSPGESFEGSVVFDIPKGLGGRIIVKNGLDSDKFVYVKTS